MRRAALWLASAALVLSGGCWDRTPITDTVIVLSMGVDRGDQPNTFAVTFELINPIVGEGTGAQGAVLPTKSVIVTGQGRSLTEALQNVQRTLDRSLFLSQLQTLVFGEELAREGMIETLDHLQRSTQLRRTMTVFIAEGTARQVMGAQPHTVPLLGIGLESLGFHASRAGAITMIFGDFLERLVEPGSEAIAPVIMTTDDTSFIRIAGIAAFRDDRVVGIFDLEESLGLSLALGEARPLTAIVAESDWQGERVVASFVLESLVSQTDVRVVDGQVEATIRVNVQSVLAEQNGGGNFTTSKEWSVLERMQEQAVRRAVEKVVKRAQEWQTDVFGIGTLIERRFPKVWKDLEPRWPEVFASMKFDVAVASRVTETGLIKEPLNTRGQPG